MSLPRYSEYKGSGVEWLGEVPGHWQVAPLKRNFKIVGGSTPKSEQEAYWDGDIVWVTPSDLSKLSSIGISDSQRKITSEGLDSCGTTLVPSGSIVLSTRAPIGSLAIAETELCTNQGCKSLVPFPDTQSHFYGYLLSISTGELNIRGKGTTFLELSGDELGAFKVSVPPSAEQQTIAAFLDRETGKIDALIAEQRRLVELLAEKRQAVISHAVTKGLHPNVKMKNSGIAWLGEVPEHWATPSLYMRYSSELGKMLDSSKITGDHLIPYLRNVDVQWGSINLDDLPLMDIREDEHQRYTIKAGDLLICEGGEVGRAAIVPTMESVFGYQKALHRLRPLNNDEDTKFMYFTLQWAANTGVFNLSGSSTIAHLTGEQLRKYRFPKPPFTEQQAIAAHLDTKAAKFDALTAEASRAIALLQERRSALISAAVTGKTDIRKAVLAEGL